MAISLFKKIKKLKSPSPLAICPKYKTLHTSPPKTPKFLHLHAVVEELAGFGAKIHLCSRNEVELNKCLEEWRIKGFNVTSSVCDVTSTEQRLKLMHDVSSVFDGKLNILE
ncbi:hypothetical protein RND81_03G152400 [Saponaria officinalis]|uniref:Uncharacterized protein n=1 Tax=Saponaria officinalis TaxID=3572 RepID=A0AAW1M0G8_SAPOF